MLQMHPTVLVTWTNGRGYRNCFSVHNARHNAQVSKIHAVHAASLPRLEVPAGQAPKQETPDPARSEASTAHPVSDTEVRAAGAQSDTNRRR